MQVLSRVEVLTVIFALLQVFAIVMVLYVRTTTQKSPKQTILVGITISLLIVASFIGIVEPGVLSATVKALLSDKHRYSLFFLVTGAIFYFGSLLVSREERNSRPGYVLVAAFCLVGAVVMGVAEEQNRWRWILALMPAAFLVTHAVYLYMFRRSSLSTDDDLNQLKEALKELYDESQLKDMVERISKARRRDFAFGALLIRYGIPAAFITGVLITYLNIAFLERKLPIALPVQATRGATYGLVGAYIYSVVHLGYRAFRHDITTGIASWTAATVAAGPIVAGAVAMFGEWKMDAQGDEWKHMSNGALYFIAGFSPRVITEAIYQIVRGLWLVRGGVRTPERSIPLGQVRGITSVIEERLAEEDILDVHGLAKADPLRLLRNTNFHKRQILTWIDNAILMAELPKTWQALEDKGITGAMTFARLKNAGKDVLGEWKDVAGFQKTETLEHKATQVAEDAHVKLITVLYHLEGRIEDETATAAAATT